MGQKFLILFVGFFANILVSQAFEPFEQIQLMHKYQFVQNLTLKDQTIPTLDLIFHWEKLVKPYTWRFTYSIVKLKFQKELEFLKELINDLKLDLPWKEEKDRSILNENIKFLTAFQNQILRANSLLEQYERKHSHEDLYSFALSEINNSVHEETIRILFYYSFISVENKTYKWITVNKLLLNNDFK